jgi:hypothetical protein
MKLQSTADGSIGPRTALDLLGTESSTWLSVEAVTNWLDIPIGEVLAQVGPEQERNSPPDLLRDRINAAEQQLRSLFKELAVLREGLTISAR